MSSKINSMISYTRDEKKEKGKMKHLVSILISLLLFGCGGGSDGNTIQVTPTTEDLKGTYTLNSINGSFLPTSGPNIDLNDINKNYSGNLYIDENYYVWEVTIEGTKLIHAGIYDINYTNPTTNGIITVVNSNIVQSASFTASSNQLVTDNIKYLHEGSYNAQEYWTKTNDKPFFQGDPNETVCPPYIEQGLCVSVVNAQTEEASSCGAKLIISNDFYYEEVLNQTSPCIDTSQLCGLLGTKGVYNIAVQKNNYYDYTADNIIITSNNCNVNRTVIQVNLETYP